MVACAERRCGMICEYSNVWGDDIAEDDSDLDELFRGVVVFALVASLGLYFADRTLFFKAVVGVIVLIILIVVAAILW